MLGHGLKPGAEMLPGFNQHIFLGGGVHSGVSEHTGVIRLLRFFANEDHYAIGLDHSGFPRA